MAIQQRVPIGDGALLQWTPHTTVDNWTTVDDPIGTPDDDTTWITESTAGETNLSTFTAFNINSGGTGATVSVTFRGKRTAGASANVAAVLRVNGVNYFGAAASMGAAYTDFTAEWNTNPNTGAAWTDADVNGTGAAPIQQFGVTLDSETGGGFARVTQYYAAAAFTDAPPADDGLVAHGPRMAQPAGFARARRTNRVAQWLNFPTFPPAELPAEEFPPAGNPGIRSSISQPKPRPRKAASEAYWFPNRLATKAPAEPEAATFTVPAMLPVLQRYRLRKAADTAYVMAMSALPPAEAVDLTSDCTVVGGAWVLGLETAGGAFVLGAKACKKPGHWGRAEA